MRNLSYLALAVASSGIASAIVEQFDHLSCRVVKDEFGKYFPHDALPDTHCKNEVKSDPEKYKELVDLYITIFDKLSKSGALEKSKDLLAFLDFLDAKYLNKLEGEESSDLHQLYNEHCDKNLKSPYQCFSMFIDSSRSFRNWFYVPDTYTDNTNAHFGVARRDYEGFYRWATLDGRADTEKALNSLSTFIRVITDDLANDGNEYVAAGSIRRMRMFGLNLNFTNNRGWLHKDVSDLLSPEDFREGMKKFLDETPIKNTLKYNLGDHFKKHCTQIITPRQCLDGMVFTVFSLLLDDEIQVPDWQRSFYAGDLNAGDRKTRASINQNLEDLRKQLGTDSNGVDEIIISKVSESSWVRHTYQQSTSVGARLIKINYSSHRNCNLAFCEVITLGITLPFFLFVIFFLISISCCLFWLFFPLCRSKRTQWRFHNIEAKGGNNASLIEVDNTIVLTAQDLMNKEETDWKDHVSNLVRGHNQQGGPTAYQLGGTQVENRPGGMPTISESLTVERLS